MSGLVGAVGRYDVMPRLLQGLREFQDGDYDSAGVALIDGGHTLSVRRCVGRVAELERKLRGVALASPVGIAHTRRASVGAPAECNAHPQTSCDQIAVVHNGTVTNHATLRAELLGLRYAFRSTTDTEVIAHLVHHHARGGRPLLEAVQQAARRLQGESSIAVVSETEPDVLVVAHRGLPLVIGVDADGQYVASEASALLPFTEHFIFPEPGDVVQLKRDDVTIVDARGEVVVRPLQGWPETRARLAA